MLVSKFFAETYVFLSLACVHRGERKHCEHTDAHTETLKIQSEGFMTGNTIQWSVGISDY